MDIHLTVSGIEIGGRPIGNPATLHEVISAVGAPTARSCPPPKGSHPEMAVTILDDYGLLARHRRSDGDFGLLEVFLATSPGRNQPKKPFLGTVWFDGHALVRPVRLSAIPTDGRFAWSYGSAVSSVLSISFHEKFEFVGRIVIGWQDSVSNPTAANQSIRRMGASRSDHLQSEGQRRLAPTADAHH
jgi:hypothetical protein